MIITSLAVFRCRLAWLWLALLPVALLLTACRTTAPPDVASNAVLSPFQLGAIVARALLVGDPAVAESCLPSFEAYAGAPQGVRVADAAGDQGQLRLAWDRRLQELREQINDFPRRAQEELGFNKDQIGRIEVTAQPTGRDTAHVFITFHTAGKPILIRLNDCFRYGESWYLTQIN